MSNFVQDFEEDNEQNTRIIQLLHGSLNTTEKGGDSSIDRTTITSKKKRNLPGNPDPDAEIVALSPRTLMATNRYICEVCHKGFQRDQNLQLHRRGHNLPWKLKQRATNIQVRKRVYICPEPNCVHHEPTRALGDLTGIKKHFCRKHGEKKWKCDKCSKRYAVQSDWKAHAKICGTREYRCDCGTIFSRKDSFVTHRAFCDALAEESYKMNLKVDATGGIVEKAQQLSGSCTNTNMMMGSSFISHDNNNDKSLSHMSNDFDPIFNQRTMRPCFSSSIVGESPMAAYTSATALLQKAAEMGAKVSDKTITPILLKGFTGYSASIFSPSTTSVHQVSSMNNCKSTITSGLHAINNESFDKNMEISMNGEHGFGISNNTSDHSGSYDSSLLMHSSKINSNNNLERRVFMGVNERMTVDFLGVEPSLYRKRDYDGNMVGMAYTNEQQSLHHQKSDW